MTAIRPGVRFMVLSGLAFAAMGALVKLVGTRLPTQEVVLARALISLVLSLAWLARRRIPPWGHHRGLLLLRGLFGFCGLSCVFYAVTHLPLAEATVIQYLHPVFTALLAGLVLRERVERGLALAIALSVAGVALVARPGPLAAAPGLALDPTAVGVAVAGAFFSACAYVTVRRLASVEDPLVIVFYFPLVTVPATLPTLWGRAVWPEGAEWALLLGVGVLAQVGQVALTRGLQHETAARATALSYLQVLFAALFGAALFGQVPDAFGAAGATLILGAAALAGRASPVPPVPPAAAR